MLRGLRTRKRLAAKTWINLTDEAVDGRECKYEQDEYSIIWYAYYLYIKPSIKDVKNIPKVGVVPDDLTVSKLFDHFAAMQRGRSWPADFDRNGILRATRTPKGLAAKVFINEGDMDKERRTTVKEDEGYF